MKKIIGTKMSTFGNIGFPCNSLTRDGGRWKESFPEVFKEGLGTMVGVKGQLYPDKESIPKLFKARYVPYAMKDKVGEELVRLKEAGVIEEVSNSEWATPIVPIS